MAPLLSINCATEDSRPAYSELRGLRGRGWRMDAPEVKGGNERERGERGREEREGEGEEGRGGRERERGKKGGIKRWDFLAGSILLTDVPCLVKMEASLVCSSCCSRV